MLNFRKAVLALLCASALIAGAYANDAGAEIDALIDSVRVSSCIFIRNGKEYSAHDAADHLKLKYSRGKRLAETSEDFIDQLASRSSLSGKLYFMSCEAAAPLPVRDWLYAKLAQYRQS